MKKLLLITVLLALPALAQQRIYVHERTTSGDELVSFVLPAGTSTTATFIGLTIYSAAACTPTLKRDGTLPTATVATSVELNGGVAGSVVPYNASNAGSLVHIKTYNLAAGEEKVIEMQFKTLTAGKAVHVQTGCAARVWAMWREF